MSSANKPTKRRRTHLIQEEGSTSTTLLPMSSRTVVFKNPGGRARRPIDKALPCVFMTGLVNTQQTQDLVTPNAPCTVMGIRWSMDAWIDDSTATADAEIAWAIVILRDGRTANTMSKTGGSNLYEPEQDVLAYGRFILRDDAAGMAAHNFEGNTKTMRKLRVGDKITFLALGTASGNSDVRGTIQVFCKF